VEAVTVLLQQGYWGNLTALGALQSVLGMSNAQAAAACLVSPHTYRRWRTDRTPNPTAIRLLSIMAGYLPWSGWSDWEMHRGFLFPPGYVRHGLSPGDVLAIPYTMQLLSRYRRLTELAAAPPASVGRHSTG
jgi:hypothetical protein